MNGSTRDWVDNFGITQSTLAATGLNASQPAGTAARGHNAKRTAVNPTWIAYNPATTQRRKDVRVHAAKASAAARKATIASKEAKRRQYVRSKAAKLATELWSAANSNATATAATPAQDAVAIVSKAVEHQEPYQKLLALVTQLHNGGAWYIRKHGEMTLASSAIRSTLWDAMTGSTTLCK